MNQIYRLITVISIVTFVQGCEFITVLDALNGLNAAARVTAQSSVKSSCESVENSESLAVSTASGDASVIPGAYFDVSGTYISEITVSGNATTTKAFLKKKNCKEITLKQTGNKITGSDDSMSLKVNGTREGKTIKFFIARGNEIEGIWEISADATRLEGKWNTDGAGGASGQWILTRITLSANIIEDKSTTDSALENQPATNFDLTGDYVSDQIDSNWSLKYKKRLRIKLVQNVNSLRGGFFKTLNGPIRGSLVGDKVELTWEAGNCSSGEGSLSVDADGTTLKGILICRSQGMSKHDVIFRKM